MEQQNSLQQFWLCHLSVSAVVFYSLFRARAGTAGLHVLYHLTVFACSAVFLLFPLSLLLREQKYDCAVQVLFLPLFELIQFIKWIVYIFLAMHKNLCDWKEEKWVRQVLDYIVNWWGKSSIEEFSPSHIMDGFSCRKCQTWKYTELLGK